MVWLINQLNYGNDKYLTLYSYTGALRTITVLRNRLSLPGPNLVANLRVRHFPARVS